MYPCEPLSAAAFMNSPSRCFSISGVALTGEVENRLPGRTNIPATIAQSARIHADDFIRPPCVDILAATAKDFNRRERKETPRSSRRKSRASFCERASGKQFAVDGVKRVNDHS